MHVAFVIGHAVEHGQKLLQRHQTVPFHRGFQRGDGFEHSQVIVFGGSFQVDAVARRLRHALKPILQGLRAQILRIIEFYFGLLRARLVPENLGTHVGHFGRRFQRMIEKSELFRQAENRIDVAFAQLEFDRQVVVHRFPVFGIAVFVQ